MSRAALPKARPSVSTLKFPPKRVLVPMDLSDASFFAWDYARMLGSSFGATAEAYFVQPWMFSVAGMGVVEPYLANEAANAAVAELRRRLGPDAKVKAEIGAVEQSILSESKRFDLIVVGTHGRTGVERALRGSIAEALLRDSERPVLVVRGSAKPVRRILAPTNFEPYAWNGFLAAFELAETYNATVSLLHSVSQALYRSADVAAPRALIEEWVGALPERLRARASGKPIVDFGSASERIATAAKDFDLVVLAAHRKGLLADAFGTTAERVLRHCPAPVLAVPSK